MPPQIDNPYPGRRSERLVIQESLRDFRPPTENTQTNANVTKQPTAIHAGCSRPQQPLPIGQLATEPPAVQPLTTPITTSISERKRKGLNGSKTGRAPKRTPSTSRLTDAVSVPEPSCGKERCLPFDSFHLNAQRCRRDYYTMEASSG